MESKENAAFEFDVVIVGAGPSAAGLLRGLLLRILELDDDDDGDGSRKGSGSRDKGDVNTIQIAVLERGGADSRSGLIFGNSSDPDATHKSQTGTLDETNNIHYKKRQDVDAVTKQKQKPQKERFAHTHPSTCSLRNWFTAAHYTSRPAKFKCAIQQQQGNDDDDDGFYYSQNNNISANDPISNLQLNSTNNNLVRAKSTSPTILHTTTPQHHLNNRIIDVPTGSGWGGTTNIHAGLVMEPCYGAHGEDHPTEKSAVEVVGDFDTWPGRWKGGKVMKGAIDEILVALKENGALTLSSNSSAGDDGALRSEKNVNIMKPKVSNVNSFVDVCSNRIIHSSQTMDWKNGKFRFQQPVTSSTSHDAKENKAEVGGTEMTYRRVNYFSALVEPLLQKHPELESHVTFLSGVQVERILIGCGCDHELDDDHKKAASENSKGGERCCTCGDNNSDIKHQARARAVECLVPDITATSDKRRVFIRAKQEIIVCAGAIGSPSLLLASGIGHEDDLREAGIIPWYDQFPSQIHCQHSNAHTYRNLPVGHNLRDHILLPRTFATPHQMKATVSCNSMHGWWLLDLPINTYISEDNNGNAKIQLQLADGIQMDSMIPHFAAAALRRKWSLPFSGCEVPSEWVASVFHFARCILKTVFGYTIFRAWTRFHTASINVCLLNPRSVGKVTIFSQPSKTTQQHRSGANVVCHNETTSSPTQLSRCQVVIDPGYLSNPRDVGALWMGWNASTDIKRRWFGSCIEILPGFPLVVLFSLARVLSAIFGNLVSPIFGSVCAKKKDSYSENIPQWFHCYVAEFANPYYHWCGTCAMGETNSDRKERNDEHKTPFVVNDGLCVQGITGLRVCDASVFPDCISAPTALTCAALGYAASSSILETNRR